MSRAMMFVVSAVLSCGLSCTAEEFLLPVKSAGGRGVRYFADHEIDRYDDRHEYAVVVVHGFTGGCSDGSASVRRCLSENAESGKVLFVAPCFPTVELLNPEEERKYVYWKVGDWQRGYDSPVAKDLSAYDVLDRIFAKLNDRKLYPGMKRVLFCGFSAGGQTISRYVAVTGIKPRAGLVVNFAAGAPSTWLYLNDARWHLGLSNRCRYAANISESRFRKNLMSRKLLCFCGTEDVGDKDLSAGEGAMAQGRNRIERFRNYRQYISADKKLKDAFRFVEVPDVGHSSQCYGIEEIRDLVFGSPSRTNIGNPKRIGLGKLAVGKVWTKTEPSEAGYDAKKLARIPAFIKERNMGTTGLMVVVGGRQMYSFGDVAEVSYIASCRKSVLSMMYGKYVKNGRIDLRQTVGDLKIDDVGGLLPIEKTATVCDLITARSGCYHPAANGGIIEGKEPPRGQTEPGSRFVYNNWDFNVAGTVFEMKVGKSIYDVFDREFAKPLMLQDWNRGVHKRTGDASKSVHLAYHFHLSTRDMARIGELMLRRGLWNGRQLVPAEWVEKSTGPVTKFPEGGGYGYMWWVESDEQFPLEFKGAFAAHGMYGQYVTVLPALDMVIAHKSSGNQSRPTKRSDYRDLVRVIISARQ